MEAVNHPEYYGGEDNTYEAIKVIDAWGLGFCLGNAVKYISRAGKKPGNDAIQDLEKAAWYLNHEIDKIRSEMPIEVAVEISRQEPAKADSKEKK